MKKNDEKRFKEFIRCLGNGKSFYEIESEEEEEIK